jgi:DUF4097 and DUF4098 domain-containing protein YvlB
MGEERHMRFAMRFVGLGLASLMLAGCDEAIFGDAWDQYKEDFHYNYPLSASGRVEVENFNGPVEITGWDQNTVDISGTKYASTQDRLKDMKVDIAASSGSVTIRTLRPLDRFGSAGVRSEIRVPRGADLERIVTSNGPIRLEALDGSVRARTSNGPVRASRVRGALDIETSNGPVEATELTGSATIRTSNGPIQLTMEAAREVRATTSNGPITVRVPAGTEADVRARSSHGPITTDFDLNGGGFISRNRLEGSIGKGGPLLDLTTSNGPIRIVKW